jgi:hypothetical protein
MLWCSATNQETKLKNLRKRRLIFLKSTPKMMERISNCPNNRQEIKELTSDFRDVLESFDAVLLYNWEEAHCSYSWQDHSSKGR